jgi:hypothetical protein
MKVRYRATSETGKRSGVQSRTLRRLAEVLYLPPRELRAA